MFAAGRDVMARKVFLQPSFSSFVFLGSRFGDVILAANQVLMQFLEITAFAPDCFAFADEALAGQAIDGKGMRADRRQLASACNGASGVRRRFRWSLR